MKKRNLKVGNFEITLEPISDDEVAEHHINDTVFHTRIPIACTREMLFRIECPIQLGILFSPDTGYLIILQSYFQPDWSNFLSIRVEDSFPYTAAKLSDMSEKIFEQLKQDVDHIHEFCGGTLYITDLVVLPVTDEAYFHYGKVVSKLLHAVRMDWANSSDQTLIDALSQTH